ncbi:cytochrome P450 9b2-like [Oppia nitens]|uniref:cytochrome P450 9b2-like n=1 Tax=Oppia nitens TaxID=1686743 RepID=UPI0023DCB8F8|nr:cytochrome P450 9b2-like [Oppia nitens]
MMTSDPKLIKNILIKDFQTFGKSITPLFSPSVHPVFSHTIDNASGDSWLRMRAVIRTLFTDRKLRSYVKKISGNLAELTKSLDKMFGNELSIVVDMKQVFINQSMDLTGNVVFSWMKQNHTVYNNNNNIKFTKLTKLVKRLFFPSKWRILASRVLPKFIVQVLDINDLISSRDLDLFADLTAQEFSNRQMILSTDTYDRDDKDNDNDDDNDDYFQSMLNRCPDFIIGKKTGN